MKRINVITLSLLIIVTLITSMVPVSPALAQVAVITTSPPLPVGPASAQVTPAPAGAKMYSGAPNVIEATATSLDSTIASVETQAVYVGPPGQFIAMEVFANPFPAVVQPTLAPFPLIENTPVVPGLPAGTIVNMVIDGQVTAVDTALGIWQIGAPPVFVYESATTAKRAYTTPPVIGDEVKVVAERTVAPGPLVAAVMTLKRAAKAPIPPPAPAVVKIGYQLTAIATTMGLAQWTVTHPTAGALTFNITTTGLTPTVIGPGILAGNAVVVDFVPGVAGGLDARSIAGFGGPMDVSGTIAPDPVIDATPVPAGLPAGP